MDTNSIYKFNVENSFEFQCFDDYYLFLQKGQEDNWDNWIKIEQKMPPKRILEAKKLMDSFFNGKQNIEMFRPAVSKTGLILGNLEAFVAGYREDRTDFYDIV